MLVTCTRQGQISKSLHNTTLLIIPTNISGHVWDTMDSKANQRFQKDLEIQTFFHYG